MRVHIRIRICIRPTVASAFTSVRPDPASCMSQSTPIGISLGTRAAARPAQQHARQGQHRVELPLSLSLLLSPPLRRSTLC